MMKRAFRQDDSRAREGAENTQHEGCPVVCVLSVRRNSRMSGEQQKDARKQENVCRRLLWKQVEALFRLVSFTTYRC